jgi:hypothetical protein
MQKSDIKTFQDLVDYAALRAKNSVRRNDPVAWAYWRETCMWAAQRASLEKRDGEADRLELVGCAKANVRIAKSKAKAGDFSEAARHYSRAKWFVIIGRNRGHVMSAKETGVELSWLRELEESAGQSCQIDSLSCHKCEQK